MEKVKTHELSFHPILHRNATEGGHVSMMKVDRGAIWERGICVINPRTLEDLILAKKTFRVKMKSTQLFHIKLNCR